MNIKFNVVSGLLIRVVLFMVPNAHEVLVNRPEVTTPAASWKRLKEGMFLFEQGISPYEGDSCHDTPLVLQYFIHASAVPFLPAATFIICDIITAASLFLFAKSFLSKQNEFFSENIQHFQSNLQDILPDGSATTWMPNLVCLLYFLNPFTISTCVAMSTGTINNCFLSLLFLNVINGNLINSTFFLALLTYQTLYPAQLICAVVFCCHQFGAKKSSIQYCALKVIVTFFLWLGVLFGITYTIDGSLHSIASVYKFILTVPDLTPNVGIFWYFFTEMFHHFRSFFLAVFQINVIIFSLPLTIKLKTRPIFLLYILTFVIAIFKSYPSVGDVAFCLCLLPLWSHTYRYMRYSLITIIMLVICTVLCPVMWNLWIHAERANANFYFASTLAYSTALVLIMTDVCMAYLKHDFHLKFGLHPKLPHTDEPAIVRLKNS